MSIKQITNIDEFTQLEKSSQMCVIHFMADWAAQCKQMNEVAEELAKMKEHKDVIFATVPAEDVSEVSLKYNIIAVPTFIILRGGNIIDRIDGANATELTKKVKTQAAKTSLTSMAPQTGSKDDLNTVLKRLINSAKCMLFMKGDPENPKCGFSRTTVELLRRHNCNFSSFDILTNEDVRQGLKKYSNWPTYPQIYIDGELVGGLDILKEMDDNSELAEILPKKVELKESLESLINSSTIMVFMKGDREAPRCGFSKQLVDILNEMGVNYNTFDILTDEAVRQGLKTYSNWPTYPQVYIKGDLIGGLDIVKEMNEDGSLLEIIKV